MKAAAGLVLLLVVGLWVGHALAASPSLLPTTSLVTTTVKLPTSTTVKLPTTTTVKLPTTTTVKVTTTTVKVTTTTVKLPTSTTVKLPTTTTVKLPTTTVKAPTTTSATRVTTTATTATRVTTTASSVTRATTTATGSSSGSTTSRLSGATSGSTSRLGGSGSGTSFGGFSTGFAGAGGRTDPGGPGAGSGAGGQTSARSTGVQRLQSSRPYLAQKGAKGKRRVTITFVLRRAGRVVFEVKQISPTCRVIGRFSVRGKKGVNRFRFAAKVNGKRLAPGTYLISAATPRSRDVVKLRLVVVKRGQPTPAALREARAANTCPEEQQTFFGGTGTDGVFGGFGGFGAGGFGATGFPDGDEAPGAATPGAAPSGDIATPNPGGVLGTTAERAAEAVRPFLVLVLGIAILLLALASLPSAAVPDPRLNDVLVRHRTEIALAGAAVLAAVAVSFVI